MAGEALALRRRDGGQEFEFTLKDWQLITHGSSGQRTSAAPYLTCALEIPHFS